MKRISIFLFFSILTATICSAKTIKLTSSLLIQATSITYYCSNGSVSPKYQYYCCVVVTDTSVRLKVYQAGKVTYDETASISSIEYIKFINHLVQQQIYYNVKDYNHFIPLCGSGTNSITVRTDDSIIFKGDTCEVLKVDNGNLCDAFVQIMPRYMVQWYKNSKVQEFKKSNL